MTHPKTELIAYLQGELGPAERERVEAHLAACAECRREQEAFREILGGLAAAPAPVPDLHWGRYRAELREKLTPRRAPRRWLGQPLSLALSTAVAGALVAVIWFGGGREPNRLDTTSPEELALGRRLDLLRQYEVVEHLDLLEDLDVIGDLDRLILRGEG
jgi:anti-sigma factor RsiW